MDEAWVESFSHKQKMQWIEFAQRLQAYFDDPDEVDADVEEILSGRAELLEVDE
jgi:hypothetical protein